MYPENWTGEFIAAGREIIVVDDDISISGMSPL
jgi:hypothetical protein